MEATVCPGVDKRALNVIKTNFDSAIQRNRRLQQLKTEERLAEELREQGWEVFSPTAVCDRVAIKDGKVFFIEFKKKGQQLRTGQQRVAELNSERYFVKFY
ncbi:MAG TPA: hypothetical protein VGQ00_04350 [Candidatus Norongarragalinales archaeon]|jgi:hypothetical protein|nr:hypothetical protein [Candidatus Norongarragalinales archaeon]